MEGFTLIDGVVAVVIVLSAILAYSRGFVREVLAIARLDRRCGAGLHLCRAGRTADQGDPRPGRFPRRQLRTVDHRAFAAVFAVGSGHHVALHAALSSAVQRSSLGGLDQGLGFLFGVLRGILLVAVAFIVYDRAVAAKHRPHGRQFALGQGLRRVPGRSLKAEPRTCPGWIVGQYERAGRRLRRPCRPAPARPCRPKRPPPAACPAAVPRPGAPPPGA
jgi:membrane protein required for colicin V production